MRGAVAIRWGRLALWLWCWLVAGCAWAARPEARPNLIFILADDLGYGDLGCYGQRRIQTPHLDRLAQEGMRFTQAYAGATVCAPSRCVLMTGLHTGHGRVRGNAGRDNPLAQALRPGDVTVASLLQRAGYATALIGKWGLGDVGPAAVGLPRHHGFDYFFGYLNQHHAHNYYPTFLWRNEEKVPLRNVVPNEDAQGGGKASQRVEYSHDLFVEDALKWVETQRDRPFFLYLALTIPHANNEARAEGMEVPDLGQYADTDWPTPQKGHAAMISRMDRDVGRLMALLQRLGLDERTIVFFSSDNGPHREGGNDPEFNDSNGPLRGLKRDLYEGGIRVPFIVRWPGHIPAGRVSDHVTWFADFLPTAAELAGVQAPRGLDGVSLVPTLLGRQRDQRQSRYLYWEFYERPSKQAIRQGDWKAVAVPFGGPIQLFNLRDDPGEEHDIAAEHPRIVRRLRRLMNEAHVPSPDWKLPLDVGRAGEASPVR